RSSTPGGSILVADDEESIRWVLERACTQHGHRVVAVASGTDALQALRSGTFDVALIDIKMPDLSGLEVREVGHLDVDERDVEGARAERLEGVGAAGDGDHAMAVLGAGALQHPADRFLVVGDQDRAAGGAAP